MSKDSRLQRIRELVRKGLDDSYPAMKAGNDEVKELRYTLLQIQDVLKDEPEERCTCLKPKNQNAHWNPDCPVHNPDGALPDYCPVCGERLKLFVKGYMFCESCGPRPKGKHSKPDQGAKEILDEYYLDPREKGMVFDPESATWIRPPKKKDHPSKEPDQGRCENWNGTGEVKSRFHNYNVTCGYCRGGGKKKEHPNSGKALKGKKPSERIKEIIENKFGEFPLDKKRWETYRSHGYRNQSAAISAILDYLDERDKKQ